MKVRPTFTKDRREYLVSQNPDMEHGELVTMHSTQHLKVLSLMSDCVMTFEDESLPGKGVTRCNRTACQSDKHVNFYNIGTNKKYCLNCALDIRFCNDIQELDLYPRFNEELDEVLNQNPGV